MTEEYIIETKKLGDGEIKSRVYREFVGKPETRREIDANALSTSYKAFYKRIAVEARKFIKKANLEEVVVTTFNL